MAPKIGKTHFSLKKQQSSKKIKILSIINKIFAKKLGKKAIFSKNKNSKFLLKPSFFETTQIFSTEKIVKNLLLKKSNLLKNQKPFPIIKFLSGVTVSY